MAQHPLDIIQITDEYLDPELGVVQKFKIIPLPGEEPLANIPCEWLPPLVCHSLDAEQYVANMTEDDWRDCEEKNGGN